MKRDQLTGRTFQVCGRLTQSSDGILMKQRTNASPVPRRLMRQAAQASLVVLLLTYLLFLSMSSKSLLNSTATWTFTMACPMDLLASKPHHAAWAEQLSQTLNVVAPRMSPSSTQASQAGKAAAASVSIALGSTATRPRAQSPTHQPPRYL